MNNPASARTRDLRPPCWPSAIHERESIPPRSKRSEDRMEMAKRCETERRSSPGRAGWADCSCTYRRWRGPAAINACTTTNGWGVATTEGLTYVPCTSGTCTRIKYDVTGGTPDHVATFIRAEAGPASAPLGGSLTQTAPCGGESVIGVGPNAVCHETIAPTTRRQGHSFASG
jgi:hypothetical protein